MEPKWMFDWLTRIAVLALIVAVFVQNYNIMSIRQSISDLKESYCQLKERADVIQDTVSANVKSIEVLSGQRD